MILNASITSYRRASGQGGTGAVALSANLVEQVRGVGARVPCRVSDASLTAQSFARSAGIDYNVEVRVPVAPLLHVLTSAEGAGARVPGHRDQLVVQRPGMPDLTVVIADVTSWSSDAVAGAQQVCVMRGRTIQ